MLTPAGIECKFFFGDYHRGRNVEECRLLEEDDTQQWSPDLCSNCPVPGILRANACKSMILTGEIHRPFLFITRKVKIAAYCQKCNCDVPEPHIGCGECHELPEIITGAINDIDTPD
jgi:hypothetical protein